MNADISMDFFFEPESTSFTSAWKFDMNTGMVWNMVYIYFLSNVANYHQCQIGVCCQSQSWGIFFLRQIPFKKHRRVAHHFCHVFFVEALNIGTKIVKGQIELVSDFKILTVPWSNCQRIPRKILCQLHLLPK